MNTQLAPTFQDAEKLDTAEDTLTSGIADFMSQSGFSQCHLGLSGGLDSALVAYLAVQALGKENVVCLILPSRFTSQQSLDDAVALAENLGCRHETISIEPLYDGFIKTLSPLFGNRPFDTTEENLQARIRGTLLMAYANKFHSMLLATSNKSELAMGYCTLYGDTCGGLAPIGNLFKTEVIELCRRINEKKRFFSGNDIIPAAIISKPPSAELRPNQKDQDTLPPYEVLDSVLRFHYTSRFDEASRFDEETSAKKIAETLGVKEELAVSIFATVSASEFKRRQFPPVLPYGKER